jgi:hypothetical protein
MKELWSSRVGCELLTTGYGDIAGSFYFCGHPRE